MTVINTLISFPVIRNNSHQIGIRYLELHTTLRKTGGVFKNIDGEGNVGEPIRLVKKAFA